MMQVRAGLFALCLSGVAACTTTPGAPSILPTNAGLKISDNLTFSLERIVTWGAYAGIAYVVLDPLSPNWDIEEAQLTPQLVHFDLKMKRYYSGGAGEARQTLDRRAKALVIKGDFASYQLVEYNESLDSSVLGSQRHAEGVIRLIPRG